MKHMTFSRNMVWIPLVVFMVSAFLSNTLYAQAVGGEIKVCANSAGAIHIIGEGFKKTSCTKGEQLISWNQTGLKGDKGEPGPKGDKGDTGLPGTPGQDGTSFHLVDANGQDLGVLLNINGNIYSTYFESEDVALTFRDTRATIIRISTEDSVEFAQRDCQGQAYTLGTALSKRETTRTMSDGSIYRGKNSPGAVINLQSSKNSSFACTNFDPQNFGNTSSYEVDLLTGLTEPIAYPLSIQ